MGSGAIRPVPTFGFRSATSTEEIRVDTHRLIWRFIEGYVTWERVWEQVLTSENWAAVQVAIREASERPEGFVLPVELWARICYDYLLAFNTQVISQNELLASMIPLYFARTATFVEEVRTVGDDQAEERIDSYAEVFGRLKPYLVRRFTESGRTRRLGDQHVDGAGDRQEEDTTEFLAIRSP
jgi:hypothetical protein